MPRVEVRTYVDADVLKEWQDRIGKYASYSYLLETAMRDVNERTRNDPTITEIIKAAISAHIERTKNRTNDPASGRFKPQLDVDISAIP